MSATGSVRYIGKKPSSAEVKERYYNVGVDVPATSSPISNLALNDNYGLSYVEVTLNGVKLDQSDFTATSGNSLSFVTGIELVSGDVLGVKSYDFASTPRVNPIIQQRQDIGTTTDSQQQTFAVAFTSTLDEVLVYLNGSLLDTSEYTANTSANEVILTNPPNNGDKLTILVYGATKVVGSAEAVTQTYIDNQIAGQASTIQASINTKIDATTATSEISRVDGDIAVLQSNKADVTYVDTQLANKATQTYVDTAVSNVAIISDTFTYDILSPQTTTTSISSTHFDNDNVIWFSNDGSLVNKTSEKDGSSGARNDGEQNNFIKFTRTSGVIYIDCKFSLMDLNELKDGTGFNASEITTARSSQDPSERWSSTLAPSSGTNGLNLSIAESHEFIPFHVANASAGSGDGSHAIVPHVPYLNDQDIIYITGIPFGGAIPPTFDPNNLTTNQYLDICDWRSDPMKVRVHDNGTDSSSSFGGKKFKLEYISGTNGLDLSLLTLSPNSIYFMRFYRDGWSDPSGYYKTAMDDGYGPANVPFSQRGARTAIPVRLLDYKICTIDPALRPISDMTIPLDSVVNKSEYQSGMSSVESTLEGISSEWRLSKGDGNIYSHHTIGSSLDDAVTNGTWFGPWATRVTDVKLLLDLCYGYKNNADGSPYKRGLINEDLSGVGSHHVGFTSNWEYKTTSNGSGNAFQALHFVDSPESYKYFVPSSHFTQKPYGFDPKWYAFHPENRDRVKATSLTIKTNGDVLISGISSESKFDASYGPLFYNSKRTAFFGASFKATATMPS